MLNPKFQQTLNLSFEADTCNYSAVSICTFCVASIDNTQNGVRGGRRVVGGKGEGRGEREVSAQKRHGDFSSCRGQGQEYQSLE